MSGAEIDIRVGLPFNLDDLLKMTFGFDELRKAIEYLLKQQRAQDDRATRMEKDLASRLYIVDKMKKDTDLTAKEVADLKDVVKALETKTEDHDQRIFEANTQVENLKINFAINQQATRDLETASKDHEERIKNLEETVKEALDRLRDAE